MRTRSRRTPRGTTVLGRWRPAPARPAQQWKYEADGGAGLPVGAPSRPLKGLREILPDRGLLVHLSLGLGGFLGLMVVGTLSSGAARARCAGGDRAMPTMS